MLALALLFVAFKFPDWQPRPSLSENVTRTGGNIRLRHFGTSFKATRCKGKGKKRLGVSRVAYKSVEVLTVPERAQFRLILLAILEVGIQSGGIACFSLSWLSLA